MSTGPVLPPLELKALHLEVRRRVDILGQTQTSIAKAAGASQPAISKLYDRPEVGGELARKLYKAWNTDAEQLMFEHRLREPAPEADMKLRDFYDWISSSHAVEEVSKKPGITVKDLLRVKATPPAGGQATPAELYEQILELRIGHVSGVPHTTETSSLEKALVKGHGKKARRK